MKLSHRIFSPVKFMAIWLALSPMLSVEKLNGANIPWKINDSPFRANLTLTELPKNPEAGILIDLPEFGQTHDDLNNIVLINEKGESLPIVKLWRGEGTHSMILAQSLEMGKVYSLYFGGSFAQNPPSWIPKTSLFMESRRLPQGAKFNSWPDLQKTWKSTNETDGAGFVGSIFQGGNPFGPGTNYISHYTGWLQTGSNAHLLLYTLSSDASFVLVNDQFEFDWPGIHLPWADQKSVHSKEINCHSDYIKIDYYHVQTTTESAGSVLGWKKNNKLETIPVEAWIHPGITTIQSIEHQHGWPVPLPKIVPLTYIGYGSQWYFETKLSCSQPLPQEWNASWQFEDGAILSGTEVTRIFTGLKPQTVTLKLTGSGGSVEGIKKFNFPDNLRQASINNEKDLARYLEIILRENPSLLSKENLESYLALLLPFGKDSELAPWIEAWLQTNPDPQHPFWESAQLSRLENLAQTNPQKALTELKNLKFTTRKTASESFAQFEMDLLVFYLQDPSILDAASRFAKDFPNSDTDRLSKIRIGDYYRLTGQIKKAMDQYQVLQKTIVDESGGKKLPAEDQAYSITLKNLIGKNHRTEAAAKLREWELRHPMAKFNSDFLLLKGRTLNLFGRWNQALIELDSFKKTQNDSPLNIDADFYRAEALTGLGKIEEAKKIENELTKNYPKAKKMTNDQ